MNHELNMPEVRVNKTEFKSDKIALAYNFAKEAHKNQFRKSGEPYFTHCEAVYKILKDEWGVEDENLLAASLLHDTIEDTETTVEQINSKFGNKVGELVSGLTNLKSDTDQETVKKILNKSYINPEVAVIKLADRIHNMRTMDHVEPEKKIKKAQETLDVYTKLAESLGIWKAKTDLEDLCFKILYPERYEKISKQLDKDKRLNPNFTKKIENQLEKLLSENKINNGKVEKKRGGYWTSVRKREKLAFKGKGRIDSFRNVDDIVSFRIQLDSIDDCYKMIPKINKFFDNNEEFKSKVDYDRFDQFIGSNKRINGYEALHITVNFLERSVKIALMTKDMEEFNKWGVISLINKGKDIKDYSLKLVFTPTESLRFLSKEATGFDFAAAISPEILAKAESINIEGNNYPLSTVIPNASMVEIVLGEDRKAPLKEARKFAAMSETKKIILEQRILEKRDKLVVKGQRKMESILIPRGLLVLSDVEDPMNKLINNLGCHHINELYFMIGSKSISEERLNHELDRVNITKEELKITSIKLIGLDKPGILANVIDRISEMNKNIVRLEQKNKEGNFNIRILVENMTPEEENKLRMYLKNDTRFTKKLVV